MNVCPATVIVPVRANPVFAATVKFNAPLPLPGEPLVIVIQLALLVAVHAQPAVVVTLTEPAPPDSVNEAIVADSA